MMISWSRRELQYFAFDLLWYVLHYMFDPLQIKSVQILVTQDLLPEYGC